MSEKDTVEKDIVKIDEIPNLEATADTFIMDKVLIATKYNRLEQIDIDRLKKWDIQSVAISYNEEADLFVDGTNFDKFIADRKTFLKIYETSIKKMSTNFHNFRYNNNINLIEVREIVSELASMINVNLNSLLTLVNLSSSEKDIMPRMAINVSVLSMMLGYSIGFSKDEVLEIGLGAIIYDIGMYQIKDPVRTKVGKYTDEEYEHMKTHTVLGCKTVTNKFHLSDKIAMIALTHHEHYDGKGYPLALKGNAIPLYSRIVTITNAYASMTNNSKLHDINVKTPYNAMREIIKGASIKFDPHLMKAFAALMCLYPIGSVVVLNNDQMGVVISSNKSAPTKPIVKIIKNNEEDDDIDLEGEVINILENEDLSVKDVLYEQNLFSKIFA